MKDSLALSILSWFDFHSVADSPVSWRWVFWTMMIFASVCTTIVLFLLPETYSPIILQNKAKRLRKENPVGSKQLYAEHEKQDWSFKTLINRTLLRPFEMLGLEPILLLITIYIAIVYGLLMAVFYYCYFCISLLLTLLFSKPSLLYSWWSAASPSLNLGLFS